ncbi:Hypothetical predicted protein [Lecanosticta acicola]|uniref:Mob1/phocein n=1 Tax=Lecanosticta acicola TaxID=111012 RepID=A0AAI9EAS2_9PEZI|nr:Hypothetical predicted protein [Lecanosticta acicola]
MAPFPAYMEPFPAYVDPFLSDVKPALLPPFEPEGPKADKTPNQPSEHAGTKKKETDTNKKNKTVETPQGPTDPEDALLNESAKLTLQDPEAKEVNAKPILPKPLQKPLPLRLQREPPSQRGARYARDNATWRLADSMTNEEKLRDFFAFAVLLNGAVATKADYIYHSRNFARQQQTRPNPNQNQNQNQSPSRTNTSSPSAYSSSGLAPPSIPAVPGPPSMTTNNMQANEQAQQSKQGEKRIPLFFREKYTTLIVKGNFMTLAAKPVLVEEGEWMSHQIVEQNRLLSGMVKCVLGTPDPSTARSLCNEHSCPTMAAGSVNYTWIDTNRQPINIPAPAYIKNILTWVNGKIQDESLFPTINFNTAPALPTAQQVANDASHWLGKTSGFPQRFESEIKHMYKQMFRCYAHLYWQHWLQFWELGVSRELNTCFIHFINVGRLFGLLSDKDTEPMQPLIDLWVRRGDLPKLKEDENEAGSSSTARATTSTPAPSTSASTAPASSSAAASAAPGTAA